MPYTLQGKIARAHPYQLDTTLTVYGAGAEAEATGKAIGEVKKIAGEHSVNKENPHNVTKKQVGLGNVDNTSDKDKPVSTAQKEAIENAARAAKDEAVEVANQKATTATYKGKLLASGWSDTAPFTQTVSIPGILSTDYPFVDIDLSEEENVLSVIEGWTMVGRMAVVENDAVVAYCYEGKPDVDIPVIFKVVR